MKGTAVRAPWLRSKKLGRSWGYTSFTVPVMGTRAAEQLPGPWEQPGDIPSPLPRGCPSSLASSS